MPASKHGSVRVTVREGSTRYSPDNTEVAMAWWGWVILALVIVLVLMTLAAVLQRRRRRGGVIGLSDPGRSDSK